MWGGVWFQLYCFLKKIQLKTEYILPADKYVLFLELLTKGISEGIVLLIIPHPPSI